jgi:hypothetical protein
MGVYLELNYSSLESFLYSSDIGLSLCYTRYYCTKHSQNYLCANSLDPVNSLYCPKLNFVCLGVGGVVYYGSNGRGEQLLYCEW